MVGNDPVGRWDRLGLKTKILILAKDRNEPQIVKIVETMKKNQEIAKKNLKAIYDTFKKYTKTGYKLEFILDGKKVNSFDELIKLFDKYYGVEEITVPDTFDEAKEVVIKAFQDAVASDKDHIYIVTHGIDSKIQVKDKVIDAEEFFKSLHTAFKEKDTHKLTLRACLLKKEAAEKIKEAVKAAEITYSNITGQNDSLLNMNIQHRKDYYSVNRKKKILTFDFKVKRQTNMITK
jgi:hypothetical protein